MKTFFCHLGKKNTPPEFVIRAGVSKQKKTSYFSTFTITLFDPLVTRSSNKPAG